MPKSLELDRLEQACSEYALFVRDTRPTAYLVGHILHALDALTLVDPRDERRIEAIADKVQDLGPEAGAAGWAREYGGDLLRCIDALRRSNQALVCDREELQRENAILRSEARRCA